MRWQSESDERRHRFAYEEREASNVRGVPVEPKRRRHFVLPPHSTLASHTGMRLYQMSRCGSGFFVFVIAAAQRLTKLPQFAEV